MTLSEQKVRRRFIDNIWPSFACQRKVIKESGIEKLCSNLYIDYFTIIRKVIKNELSLAEKKLLCPPVLGLKISVKTKMSQEILNKQAYVYANYSVITLSEFLDYADVIISINIVDSDKRERELIYFSWQDLKDANEIGALRYSRTKFGFDNPEISEYLAQLLNLISEERSTD